MKEKEVGVVTHYFSNAQVAAVEITKGDLAISDVIHIKGHTTDFTQKIESMQLEHEAVEKAKKGTSIGIRVNEHARVHDIVYKVID